MTTLQNGPVRLAYTFPISVRCPYFTLIDLIRETHGAAGVAEFEQAYHNPRLRRKKRFGLF